MDRGASQATVHRVVTSQTRLKLLSMHTHTVVLTLVLVPFIFQESQFQLSSHPFVQNNSLSFFLNFLFYIEV